MVSEPGDTPEQIIRNLTHYKNMKEENVKFDDSVDSQHKINETRKSEGCSKRDKDIVNNDDPSAELVIPMSARTWRTSMSSTFSSTWTRMNERQNKTVMVVACVLILTVVTGVSVGLYFMYT